MSLNKLEQTSCVPNSKLIKKLVCFTSHIREGSQSPCRGRLFKGDEECGGDKVTSIVNDVILRGRHVIKQQLKRMWFLL